MKLRAFGSSSERFCFALFNFIVVLSHRMQIQLYFTVTLLLIRVINVPTNTQDDYLATPDQAVQEAGDAAEL